MIKVNMIKARNIAHEKRRSLRSEEFKPLDILATIPGKIEEVEVSRQAIRDKYASMQTAIDMSLTPDELKNALEQGGV